MLFLIVHYWEVMVDVWPVIVKVFAIGVNMSLFLSGVYASTREMLAVITALVLSLINFFMVNYWEVMVDAWPVIVKGCY